MVVLTQGRVHCTANRGVVVVAARLEDGIFVFAPLIVKEKVSVSYGQSGRRNVVNEKYSPGFHQVLVPVRVGAAEPGDSFLLAAVQQGFEISPPSWPDKKESVSLS